MTVKVVGEDTGKIKKTTCGNCAAILEYTLADTETKVIRDYLGDADTCRFLECPRCKTKLQVSLY